MDTSSYVQRLRNREFEYSGLVSSSETLALQDISQYYEVSPCSPSSGQDTPAIHGTRKRQNAEHPFDQSEPSAVTSLLNEGVKEAVKQILSPARWNALGLSGICILVLGTAVISASMVLLAYVWRSSMRAQAGHVNNGQLWDLIVESDWTSVTVTLTAAVIRVCVGLQMSLLTGMVASLLIERTGVPMSSAPLISILRAVSASPYQLVSKTVLKTPLAIAIGSAVLLIGASQFTSTALLIDFKNMNITTPKETLKVFYGSESAYASGTLRGLKIWNSQPATYFRFAEQRTGPVPNADVNEVDDSGTAIRAILPFPNVADRINLRGYDGSTAVFDSRVVCTKPNLQIHNFTTEATASNSRFSVIASGSLTNPQNVTDLEFDRNYDHPPNVGFQCVIAGPKASENASHWPISICSVDSDYFTPWLRSPLRHTNQTRSASFLIFNTTGPYYKMNHVGNKKPKDQSHTMWRFIKKVEWTSSEHGIWSHWQPTDAYIGATVSVSICFTNLHGVYKNVSIASHHNGFEPSLLWDRDHRKYETATILDRYINVGDNVTTRLIQGIMDLSPKTHWGPESKSGYANEALFDAVADDMPSMDFKNGSSTLKIPRCVALLPGAPSLCAVHNTHAELFQDIAKKTGSLAQGLQGLFTVLRQMAYYDDSRYFDRESAAVVSSSSEKFIPTQWNGFTAVAVTIVAHFSLLTVITVLFLGWTKASWLGNVWVSLSQVVCIQTEDLIDTSTDKDDKAVEKMILKVSSGTDGKSTSRVRVTGNQSNGRNELSLI